MTMAQYDQLVGVGVTHVTDGDGNTGRRLVGAVGSVIRLPSIIAAMAGSTGGGTYSAG